MMLIDDLLIHAIYRYIKIFRDYIDSHLVIIKSRPSAVCYRKQEIFCPIQIDHVLNVN